MATAAELLAGVLDVDRTLVVDNSFRTINIPSSVPNLGVEHDDDVLYLDFKMPRYLGDTDLSVFSIQINYINAKGESDAYSVLNPVIGSQYITFNWLVGPTATRYKGDTEFNICAKTLKTDGEDENGDPIYVIDREFNTTPASLPVLVGLEVDESVVAEYSDLIEQWRGALFGIRDTAEAEIVARSAQEQEAIRQEGAEVLATIPAEYTETAEAAQEGIRTKADAIICKPQGEMIAVSDASDDHIRGLKIFGKIEQVSTTGKNLLNNTSKTMTISGLTFTVYNNGEILVSGSATQDVYYDVGSVTYTGAVEYAITGCPSGGSTNTYSLYAYYDGGMYSFDTGSGNVFTPSTDQSNLIRILIKSGITVSNLLFRPMIRISSNDDDSYEPYSGGLSSPSPTWPQEVTAITNPTIKVTTHNLFGGTTLADAIYSVSKATTSIKDETAGTVSFTGAGINGATICSGPFRPNTQYTFLIYGQNTAATVPYTNLSFLYEDGTVGPTHTKFEVQGENSYIAITSETGKTVRSIIGKWTSGTVVLYYDKSGLFEGVKTADDFEPYAEQSMAFEYTLSSIPMSDGTLTQLTPTYIDENGQWWVCDEIDLERGVYIQRVKKVALNGDNLAVYYNTHGNGLPYIAVYPSDIASTSPVISNRYKYAVANWSSDDEYLYCTNKAIVFNDSRFTEATDAVEYWSTELPEVIYALATPIETPLTAEEIQWFKNAHTNFPNTTVFNDAGATMELTYNADTKTWIENRPGASDEQIVSAVNNYLDENPIESGATAEQAAQIQANTEAIGDVEAALDSILAIQNELIGGDGV